jgi:hypothetical protein
VKINSSHGPIMLFKTVNECAHAIVPQLDSRGMKGHQNPWPAERVIDGSRTDSAGLPLGVESYSFRSGGFRLELSSISSINCTRGL